MGAQSSVGPVGPVGQVSTTVDGYTYIPSEPTPPEAVLVYEGNSYYNSALYGFQGENFILWFIDPTQKQVYLFGAGGKIIYVNFNDLKNLTYASNGHPESVKVVRRCGQPCDIKVGGGECVGLVSRQDNACQTRNF